MPTSSQAGESIWLQSLRDGVGFSYLLGSGPGEALGAFWRDVFGGARPGSRVLEIGCGSGDVSGWAVEAGRRLEVIASDIHEHPEAVRLRPGMAFLGNARAEALPLPPASVDMVVSNFAFEYTPSPQQAASELDRVLRPGGAAALVIHSTDSVVTAISREHLDSYQRLAEADVPGRVRRAAALRADHLSRRKLLKDVLQMRGTLPGGEPWFEIADRLLRGDPKARQDYEALEQTVERATEIAQRQVQAAHDEAGLAGLKQRFAGLGLQVFTTEITATYGAMGVKKFGWLMFLNKPVHAAVRGNP